MRGLALATAVGLAYYLAADFSLGLLMKPDGVAVFWPAAGISSGVLIALGPKARWPVALGAIAATLVANLMGDRTVWAAGAFAICNAGEALITAGLIQRYGGAGFRLDRLRHVLLLFAAAIAGTVVSGIGGAISYKLFHSSGRVDLHHLVALVRVGRRRHRRRRPARHRDSRGGTAAAAAETNSSKALRRSFCSAP